MDKKGQGLSVTTIVLVILAVIVLVILVAGFAMGWQQMWSKVTGFFTTTNVDAIVSQCKIHCTTASTFEFCCTKHTVRGLHPTDPKKPEELTCDELDNRTALFDCDIDCTDVCPKT